VALLFGARDWLREHLDATLANPGALVFSCCIIGVAESIIYCPLDLLKARMQVRARISPFPNEFACKRFPLKARVLFSKKLEPGRNWEWQKGGKCGGGKVCF
jgi:hypothetical protein